MTTNRNEYGFGTIPLIIFTVHDSATRLSRIYIAVLPKKENSFSWNILFPMANLTLSSAAGLVACFCEILCVANSQKSDARTVRRKRAALERTATPCYMFKPGTYKKPVSLFQHHTMLLVQP